MRTEAPGPAPGMYGFGWTGPTPQLGLLASALVALNSAHALKPAAAERLSGNLLVGAARTIRAPLSEATVGSLEYRCDFGSSRFSAFLCFEWLDGDRAASMGFFFRIYETESLLLGIGSGPGYFHNGKVTLGNRLEFRSVAELQFKLKNGNAWGIDYCHYSNGGTGSINPGAEALRVFLRIQT